MAKRILSRKTSRGAAPKPRALNNASAMRYAGRSVETLGSIRENPGMFGFGHYEHFNVPSLQEATQKAQNAMDEGRLRAAVTYALDLSELLLRIPAEKTMPGGELYEAAEEAREVGSRVIGMFQESMRRDAR